MDTQDPRTARAAALAAARRKLTRLKVAALSSSVLAFGGMTAGMALNATSKVVASSSVSAAAVTVPVAATTTAVATATPAATTTTVAATATPTAAPTAAAVATTKTTAIVSAQS